MHMVYNPLKIIYWSLNVFVASFCVVFIKLLFLLPFICDFFTSYESLYAGFAGLLEDLDMLHGRVHQSWIRATLCRSPREAVALLWRSLYSVWETAAPGCRACLQFHDSQIAAIHFMVL